MQDRNKILQEAIGRVVEKIRKQKKLKFTIFCYENDIPMSTYDGIVNASNQSSFYNIGKIIKALGLTYKEFGELLDKELPKCYWEND